MSASFWVTILWVGAAVLILFLPLILSTWTGFAIALSLSVLVIWKAFAPKRDRSTNREDRGASLK